MFLAYAAFLLGRPAATTLQGCKGMFDNIADM
jgi:hypothetical protein